MIPPVTQKNPDPHEQDFIMTIQKALGRPTGPAFLQASELFGVQPPGFKSQLKTYLNKDHLERRRLLDLFIEQAGSINLQVIPMKNASQTACGIQKLIQETEPEWGTQKSVIAWQHPLIDQLNLEKKLATDNVTLHITQTA